MATVNGIQKRENTSAAKAPSALSVAINSAAVQKRFEMMLGENAGSFLSSVLTVCNNSKLLRKADYRTVLAAAATAASLKLSITPDLGEAYIVPYGGQACYQTGYRGLIQLAQRSCRMKKIIMTPVREGEFRNWCVFDETYTLGERISNKIVGYFAHIETTEGFEKSAYWTKEEVIEHAKRFSKAYKSGPWQTDFDSMACKTVLIPILKTYAPKSVDLIKALENENKVASMDENTGEAEYIDVDVNETQEEVHEPKYELQDAGSVNVETGEIFTLEEIEASMK